MNFSMNRDFPFATSTKSKFYNSSKGDGKYGFLTGISTYAYEVMEMPMKKSFTKSLRRNQKAKNRSIKWMCDRAHTQNSGVLKWSPAKQSKRSNPNHKISNMGSTDENSIFDNLPAHIQPKVNNSVYIKSKSKPLAVEKSVDFYQNSNNFFKITPKDNISLELSQKLAKMRKQNHQSLKSSNNTRRGIAQRIYSKLQNWPESGLPKQKGQQFKKFYWTKDYSH